MRACGISNVETGVAVDTLSGTSGLFRVGALVPGSYRVEVQAPGFTPATRGPVTVLVSQTVALDVTLAVSGRTPR